MKIPTMMKVQSCILILSWICGNEVIGEFINDVLKLKPLIDGFDKKIFDDKDGLQDDITCDGMDFINCYGYLQDSYIFDIQDKVVDTIDKHTIKLLEDYNNLVLSLLAALDQKYLDSKLGNNLSTNNFGEDIIGKISFETSNIYCVINFLKMFNTNSNDKLRDYIFFSLKDIIQLTDLDEFRRAVNSHFEHRMDRSPPMENKQTINNCLHNLIPTAKRTIINSSTPFCFTQIPRKNVDSWMWKKLKNSYLLSQKVHTNESLMDWQDLEVF